MNTDEPYVSIGDNIIMAFRGNKPTLSTEQLAIMVAQARHESADFSEADLENMAKFMESRAYELNNNLEHEMLNEVRGHIPVVKESDVYTTYAGGVGSGRGPKGGVDQRIEKRRKANKAARKARRHVKA